LKLDGVAPNNIALTAFRATSAAKEAVVSHMGLFNILQRKSGNRACSGCQRQCGLAMIAPIESFCNIHIEHAGEPWKLTVKMRLDRLAAARGCAGTRSKAQDLIRRGAARLAERIALNAGIEVAAGQTVEVLENKRYVARSAWNLLAALDYFVFLPEARAFPRTGTSTGGFMQVLLERGAARVFAVDKARVAASVEAAQWALHGAFGLQ
jgi:ribosomal 50S subunit-recycling heat shock protein